MTFIPKPIDLSDVDLPQQLYDLIEILAKNTHEVWAESRIKDGWTYGVNRDDVLKQHPCLLPYEEIPESEKEYDKTISLSIIKLLIKLGYKIEKG
ncbi:MAG: RyR domain-containing protein [Ignavibacteria bacterium]|nr:RyR domain-containing protein [Ignavibacteria bacterium]